MEIKHQTGGGTGWRSGTVVTYFTFMPDCLRSLNYVHYIGLSQNNSPTLFNR